MFGNLGNIGDLLKNAGKMKQMVQDAQAEMENTLVDGESGGGAVKLTTTVKGYAKSIEIDSALLSEDKAVLEELITAAINDARQKAEKITEAKMMDAQNMFSGILNPNDDAASTPATTTPEDAAEKEK